MEESRISILGSEWVIYKDDKYDPQYYPFEDANGVTLPTFKHIRYIDPCKHKDFCDMTDIAKRRIRASILRHEIIHAFIAEAGMPHLHAYHMNGTPWWNVEECVDWFAIMWPKLATIYRQLKIDKL